MAKKKAPKAPDPMQVASQQASFNKKAATDTVALNAKGANRTGPFGSATTQVDENGVPTGQTLSLSDVLSGASGNIQDAAATQSSFLPDKKFSLDDVPQGMDIAKATFDQGMTYLKPQLDQQRQAQDIQLTNRGLPIGAEARNIAEGNLADSQNRAITDLTQRAILQTPQEQQRQIGNKLTERNQGAQDLSSSLASLGGLGSLIPQAPQLAQASIGAGNYQDAANTAYQGELSAYNNKMAGIGQLAKLGIGMAAAPFTGGSSLAAVGAGGAGIGMMGNGPRSSFGPYSGGLPWAS